MRPTTQEYLEVVDMLADVVSPNAGRALRAWAEVVRNHSLNSGEQTANPTTQDSSNSAAECDTATNSSETAMCHNNDSRTEAIKNHSLDSGEQPSDPTDSRAEALKNHSLDSGEQPSDPTAQDSSNAAAERDTAMNTSEAAKCYSNDSDDVYDRILFSETPEAPTKPERQNKMPQVQASGTTAKAGGSHSADQATRPAKRARASTGKPRKGGWLAASHSARTRPMQEYTDKKQKWDRKIQKCKNALARTIVRNAFAEHTSKGWKGTHFPREDVVAEKERGVGYLGQSIVGRGAKPKQTIEAIEKRYHTYLNDALRYASIISKIEKFESWGSSRKMLVRNTIEGEIARMMEKELNANRP